MADIIENPAVRTLEELLLASNRQFRIPIYQRDYAWDDDQIDDFVTDVFAMTSTGQEHLFGTIVLSGNDPGPTYEGNDSPAYVIDGQQRLTTSVIALAAIRHHLHELSMAGSSEAPEIATEELKYTAIGRRAERRPRIYANRSNQEFLTPVLDGTTKTGLEVRAVFNGLSDDVRQRSGLMLSAYNRLRHHSAHWVARQLSLQLDENMSDLASLVDPEKANEAAFLFEKLSRSLATKSIFVEIQVKEWADAFAVFEGLNNRGVELAERDLIKNMVLAKAHKDPRLTREKLADLERKWEVITSRLRSTSASRFSRFLRHYLLLTHTDVTLKRVVRVFQNSVASLNADEIIEQLLRAATAYGNITSPSGITNDDKLKHALQQLNDLEAERSRPIPLAAILAGISSDGTCRILAAVETLYFRRSSILGWDNKALESDFRDVAALLFANGESAVDEAIETLRSLTPDDETFKRGFVTRSGMKHQIARYMLTRMENYWRKETIVSVRDANVTLEHIMPREPSEWSLSESDRTNHAEIFIQLGNLTLLTSGSNSSLSNSPFETKRAFYRSEGNHINKDVVSSATWDSSTIRSRQESMAILAAEIWSLPSAD